MKETPDQEIQKIDEKLEILYAEYADVIKKRNSIYEELAEIEKEIKNQLKNKEK